MPELLSPDFCPACQGREFYLARFTRDGSLQDWRCHRCAPLPSRQGKPYQPFLEATSPAEEPGRASGRTPSPLHRASVIVPARIYTAGYQGRLPEQLFTAAKRVAGKVFDIRYAPFSGHAVWNRDALRPLFGVRYEWLPALGNANYRLPGERVCINDMEAGLARVLSSPWPPILLCACREYPICHRAVVAEALVARGRAVEELAW